METNQEKMETFCSGKSVAIIGNSENVTDYEVGEVIDSYDIVLRMNRFSVGEEYKIHTGTKTNIYATCFWNKVLHPPTILENYPIEFVFCSIPNETCEYFPDPKEYKRNLKKARKIGWDPHLKDTIVHPSPEYYDEIGGFIGKRPSTGCIALSWFLDYIEFDHLYVTGMSFGYNKYHYNQENYNGVGPGRKHHNPHAEKFALYKCLDRCDKDVLLDPHMSSVIGQTTDEDFHQHQATLRESAR